MGVSKVEINNADGTKNVLVDLTGDTVTADKMLENETAHGADGEPITGTIVKRTQILSVNHVNDKGVIVGNNIGSGGVERLGLAYYTKNDRFYQYCFLSCLYFIYRFPPKATPCPPFVFL